MANNFVRIAKAVRCGSKDAALRDLSGHDEFRKAFAKNVTRNSGRDFWYWKDKSQMELGAIEALLEAAGFDVVDLSGRADDPPDCEAILNGDHCRIEATELVHQKALKRSIRGDQEMHFIWDKVTLHKELQARIVRKDHGAANARRGPYQRYILIVYTDEIFLDRASVARFLAGTSFRATFVTDVFLGLSYDPAIGKYPIFKLRLSRE